MTDIPSRANISTLGRYALLQRLSDQSLEELLQFAGPLCGAPMALVALLGEGGGWFNEAVGMKSEEAMRYFGLCGYVLLQPGFFEIPDLAAAGPFAGDKLVKGQPGLRWFAGRALHGGDGQQLGAFCVFDTQPRQLDERERKGLLTLASQIESHLQLRTDLLALRKTHREQLERIQLLEGVLQAANRFAIISVDKKGTIRSFNRGAEQLLGYPAAEVMGRVTPAMFHLPEELQARASSLAVEMERPPEGFEILAARARAVGSEQREWTWRRKDGGLLPVQLVVAAAKSEEGELTGFVAIGQDISERKAAERVKDEFISVVSHELRTPLTAIRGSLGLIAAGALGDVPSRLVEPLNIAHANSMRMVHLVNDILDLAKIESGTFEFRFDQCSPAKMIERAVEMNRAYGDQYGVSLRTDERMAGHEVAGAAEVMVRADFDRVVQALTNLLSNAAKFSPRGAEVVVGANTEAPISSTGAQSTTSSGARRGERVVRFWVRDQGPGIDEEFRAHVFKRFMQADASDHRQKGGTGLGLSIVRSIVQSHGGQVGFDTEVGRGTTFFFDLPVAVVE